MKFKTSILAALAWLTISLSGCIPQYDYSKSIRNATDHPVTVQFDCCGSESVRSFVIEPGETKVIHACIYETLRNVPDCAEKPLDIDILAPDGQALTTDIADPAQWEQSTGERSVSCLFVIRNQDIKTETFQ